jgi:hypothetical protein
MVAGLSIAVGCTDPLFSGNLDACMPSSNCLAECVGCIRAEGISVGLNQHIKDIMLQPGRFFCEVFAESFAAGIGSRPAAGLHLEFLYRAIAIVLNQFGNG